MRALVLSLLFVSAAAAHGMRSAYLEVTELEGGRALLRLSANVPVTGLAVAPPEGCSAESEAPLLIRCADGLAGRTLRIDGIGALVSEVVVRVTFLDGETSSRVVTATLPFWTLPRRGRVVTVLTDYARMGLDHIFSGLDHLLFLAALAVSLRRLRAILLAETAFTASHTLTFTASALGLIHVSSAAAEACIALSLMLIALDAAEERHSSTRSAAALAFTFGLVHGLGFAGGLAEIGLPDRAVGWALAGFAAGVECGQVIFLVAFVAVLTLVMRARRLRRAPLLAAYAVGSIGAFLFFQRLMVVLRRSP